MLESYSLVAISETMCTNFLVPRIIVDTVEISINVISNLVINPTSSIDPFISVHTRGVEACKHTQAMQ